MPKLIFNVVKLVPCKCSRNLPKQTHITNQHHNLENTTCSDHAYARGSEQKVMAFSFYEKDPAQAQARELSGKVEGNVNMFYFAGLEINLELLPKHYPGWVIRLYHDIEETDPLMDTLCEYYCKYSYLDLCNAKNLPTPVLQGRSIFIFCCFFTFV